MVVSVGTHDITGFLKQLIQYIKSKEQRCIVVTGFKSSIERVASKLRQHDINIWAWSGNAVQLTMNLKSFHTCPTGMLLCDMTYLNMNWVKLNAPYEVICVLPLNTQLLTECCQLTSIATPNTKVSFVSFNGKECLYSNSIAHCGSSSCVNFIQH